jgi:hypothetical protein
VPYSLAGHVINRSVLVFFMGDKPIALIGPTITLVMLGVVFWGLAELLKINEKAAYKLAAGGKIPGFKVGGSWRFDHHLHCKLEKETD